MEPENEEKQSRPISEIVAIIEALIFVADEPLTVKLIADVLEEDRETITAAVEELKSEYETREGGLQLEKSRAVGRFRQKPNITTKFANS